MPRKVHGFSVTVIKAKDLLKSSDPTGTLCLTSEVPNPYVVLHMLPDPETVTTQHTHTQLKTNDPLFSEMFFFTCPASSEAHLREIHVGVWNHDQNGDGPPGFMGHVTIPLGPVISKKSTNRTYHLSSLDDDTELLTTLKKSRKVNEDERRNKPRDFVKTLQKTREGMYTTSVKISYLLLVEVWEPSD
jgi:hypothetical protein